MAQGPLRSPRAARNAHQARILRAVVGLLVVAVLAGAGWGVTWLRKMRAERAQRAGSPESAPSEPEPAATRPVAPASRPATSRAATTQPREFRADREIAAIRKRLHDGTVQGAWLAAQALRTEAASWKSADAPENETNKLLAAVLDLETWILDKKPMFPPLREKRGETRWPETLGDYEDLNARFLTKADATRLTGRIKQLDAIADANHGWVPKAEYEAVAAPLVAKAMDGRRAFDALLGTRWGKAAREVEIRDLADLRTALPGARFRAFYHLPYLLLVEQDERWEESEEAERVARILLGLRKTFFEVYGQAMGLVPDEQRPVPVVVFASREGYHQYRSARKEKDVAGTEAHFEPKAERLVLHHDCAPATLLHEATHQLIRANVRAPLTTYQQAFWFHEGVAEWFAGSRQLPDGPDGLPRWEIGLLLARDTEHSEFLGPLAILNGTPRANRFSLENLLELMVQDRDKIAGATADGANRIRLIYAQGWFLIYFLDHYRADARGMVEIGAPGLYRDAWLRYLKREMEGASGKAAFLEALAPSGADLAKLEREMNAYLDWVIRKVAKGQVRDQKLARWNDATPAESRPAASENDDRLELK